MKFCIAIRKRNTCEFKKQTLNTLNDSVIENDASTSVESVGIHEHEIIKNDNCIVDKNENDFYSNKSQDIESTHMKASPSIHIDLFLLSQVKTVAMIFVENKRVSPK